MDRQIDEILSKIRNNAEKQYPNYLARLLKDEPYTAISFPLDFVPKNLCKNLRAELKLCGDCRIRELDSGPLKSITFDTATGYLNFLGKTAEVEQLKKDVKLIVDRYPQFKDWVKDNAMTVISKAHQWEGIIEVLDILVKNQALDVYMRELKVCGDTKFTERNIDIVCKLLKIIDPEAYASLGPSNFEDFFGFKENERLVRFRFLDERYSCLFQGMDDISVPVTNIKRLDLDVRNVFVVENLVSLLRFPPMPYSIVIFGMGYGVGTLKDIPFILNAQRIYYWGDIDTQGFEALSLFRGLYPSTVSLMMDADTFISYYNGVKGTESTAPAPKSLTVKEQEMYRQVKANQWRLEQEKIDMSYVQNTLISLY